MPDQIVRGYFGLGEVERVVRVTNSADFLVSIWARNIDVTPGGVQVITPPSRFRGSGSTGPWDGLVLDVPPQTGVDLGPIGGQGGEEIAISNAGDERVVVFLTVITAPGATVEMVAS